MVQRLPRMKPLDHALRIAVLGDAQVGKSALAVRYLTKRFIGEYRSDKGKQWALKRCYIISIERNIATSSHN